MNKGFRYKLSSIENVSTEYMKHKKEDRHSFSHPILSDVNDKFKCVALLQDLNDTINTLYKLSDTAHYLDYIFNSSTITNDKLKEEGFDEDYFLQIAYKFEYLRSIIFGDTFDWNELFDRLYLELLDYEHRWHMTEESYNRKLLHNEKIYMDKLRELGAVNEDGSVDITYEQGSKS